MTSLSNLDDAAVNRYMAVAYSAPILTAEQELDLMKKFQLTGDNEALKHLVVSHMRFVIFVARKYQNFGIGLADLIQEGMTGFLKAVNKFDVTLGVRLVSFAFTWVKAAMHEYILKNWNLVKIATTKAQRKLFFNLHKFTREGHSLTSSDVDFVAQTLKVDRKDVLQMEQRLSLGSELAITSDADDESHGVELIATKTLEPEVQVEMSDYLNKRDAVLNSVILQLDARSQDVIYQRYFVENKMKLADLALKYEVSTERIRQVEQQALKKIRSYLLKDHTYLIEN